MSYGELRHMDHRDWPLWWKAADAEIAKRQMRMCEAIAYPHMSEEDQRQYMNNLIDTINGTTRTPDEPRVPTAAEEAEWAANRAEILAIYGRIE